MRIEELVNKLLDKALECADRNDFEKCEQATRILLSLPRADRSAASSKSPEQNTRSDNESPEQKKLDEKEALENLELANDSYRGQLWLTVSEAADAFGQPAHEIKKWIELDEVEHQPRPNDKRGTKLVNSISVAARIDRGHCPPTA